MKKIAICSFVLVMLLSAASFATSTRTWVMGDNDRIMVDDGNIFRYPGRTFNYPNLALGEFSDGDFDNFGITWQFGEEKPWVLGTFVSTWPYYGPVGYDGSPLALFGGYYYMSPTDRHNSAAQSSEELYNYGYPYRIQMLYARQFSGYNFGFGLDATRASWEMDQAADSVSPSIVVPSDKSKQTFSQYTFHVGLTEATSGQWDVAAYYTTGSWTNENFEGKKLTEPNGFYEFGVTGRYFYVMNPKVTLVPHGEFTLGKRGVDSHIDPYYGSIGYYDEDSLWTVEDNGTMIDLGVGLNYTTGPKMLAVLDFGFDLQQYKRKYSGHSFEDYYDPSEGNTANFTGEDKWSFMMLPYMKIGFEGEVFPWMDVRAGGTTQLWVNKVKRESEVYFDYSDDWPYNFSIDEPQNDTYLGAGFHFGRLHLDTYMDPAILTNGLYFINGTETNNLNWSVSMLYELF